MKSFFVGVFDLSVVTLPENASAHHIPTIFFMSSYLCYQLLEVFLRTCAVQLFPTMMAPKYSQANVSVAKVLK